MGGGVLRHALKSRLINADIDRIHVFTTRIRLTPACQLDLLSPIKVTPRKL
jgi:hypothetical protein